MSREINKGVSALLPFRTKNNVGTVVDADSLPTVVRISVNGTQVVTPVGTVTQLQDSTPANIAGHYQVSVPTGALAAEDFVTVSISAIIGGKTVTDNLCFTIIERTGGNPTIESCE